MTENLHWMPLFHRIAHAINASLDLNETLQAILHSMCDTLGVEAVTIRLLNSNADALDVVASSGVSQAFLDRLPTRIVADSVQDRVLGGETIHIADLNTTGISDPTVDALRLACRSSDAEQISGVLLVPLQVRNRTMGSLDLYCAGGRGFDNETINLAEAIADLSALAIQNARLHTALLHIARAMTSSLKLQPMLDQVLAATVMEMGLKAASVRLLDSTGKHLELVAAHGLSGTYLAKGPVTVAQSPIDQRLLAGELVRLYNVSEDSGFQYPAEAEAEGIRSVLAVPLRVKERIIGVMRVYSAQPRPFTAVGIEFLQSVAGMVGVAIENAKLYEALQARYDDLKADVSEWYRFLSLG